MASTPDGGRVVHAGDDETCRLVAERLGVLPDHDVKLFVGIEGIHDISFLRNIARILLDAGEDVPDLSRLEADDEIIFIPCGGSNLGLWISRLLGPNRPEFHIFDRDCEPPEKSPHQDTVDAINKRPTCTVLTMKREMENYLGKDAIVAIREKVEVEVADYADVSALAAEAPHAASESEKSWEDIDERKRSKEQSNAKRWPNISAVAAMTPALLTARDPDDEVRQWLGKIREMLGE